MKLMEAFLSPIGFSIGFLTPFFAQGFLFIISEHRTLLAYGLGLGLSLIFGFMAHYRGSWIWVKDNE